MVMRCPREVVEEEGLAAAAADTRHRKGPGRTQVLAAEAVGSRPGCNCSSMEHTGFAGLAPKAQQLAYMATENCGLD